MSAITDLDDLVNRLTGGASGTPEDLWFMKYGRVGGAGAAAPQAGLWTSLWQYDGIPAGGAAPGAVAIPDNATNGGLKQTDPGGGREKWLLGLGAAATSEGTLLLYDRLLHISGFSGTTTSAQTVGGTLTRNTGGIGNLIAVEIYTQIGATGTTIVASYTNQAGSSGRTTPLVVIGGTGFREAQRLMILPLQAGDTGVQAVANLDLTATTGTAGDFGCTIMRPLAMCDLNNAGVGPWRSMVDGHPIPEIDTDACLALAWLSGAGGGFDCFGTVTTVEA